MESLSLEGLIEPLEHMLAYLNFISETSLESKQTERLAPVYQDDHFSIVLFHYALLFFRL